MGSKGFAGIADAEECFEPLSSPKACLRPITLRSIGRYRWHVPAGFFRYQVMPLFSAILVLSEEDTSFAGFAGTCLIPSTPSIPKKYRSFSKVFPVFQVSNDAFGTWKYFDTRRCLSAFPVPQAT